MIMASVTSSGESPESPCPIKRRRKRDLFFVVICSAGVLIFGFLGLSRAKDHQRFGQLSYDLSQLLSRPVPGLPASHEVARDLEELMALYRRTEMAFTLRLYFGLGAGLVLSVILISYLVERRQSEDNMSQTALALAEAIADRDDPTGAHSREVRTMAQSIARKLNLPSEALSTLALAAQLHDLGKIAVPDHILRQPGPLTEADWEIIKLHPVAGANIVGRIPCFKTAAAIIRHHHEHFDGSGYPDGLKGEAIPYSARIIAVADAYQAMTTDRPYRKALPSPEVESELRRQSGRQFDPMVVEACLEVLKLGQGKGRVIASEPA